MNGLAATVQAATATQLTICIPAGATSGPITVTTPAGSSTSSTAFTVTADSGAPTITGFTPTLGTAGTAVTITGRNFEATPSSNLVRFNVRYATVGSATPTTMATTVPAGTGSGRISVTTPVGKAVSATDFFVPPAPYTPADVGVTGRIVVGGNSLTVTLSTAYKIALIVFDGTAGQRLSLGVSSATIQNLYVTIFSPDGTTLVVSSQITSTGGAVDTPVLPTTGTYSVLVDPNAAYTGNATLTLSEELTGTLTINGPVLPITLRPGQRARLSFDGTAGQRLSLGVSSVTIQNLYVTSFNADGTTLMSSSQITTTGGTMDLPLLPTTGAYSVLVDPNAAHSGNATLTLSEELTGTLTVNGPSLPLTLARVGQNARLTVAGTAEQVVTVRLTSNTAGWVAVTLRKPDGTVLTTTTTWVSAFNLATQTLPTTGTYTVTVNPTGINTGSITVTVTSP